MLFWHVPAPNEALLISGSKRRQAEITSDHARGIQIEGARIISGASQAEIDHSTGIGIDE